MARVNQLIRKPRKVKKAKSDVPALVKVLLKKGEFVLGFIQQLQKNLILL